jgi:hypothetical protein
MKALNSITLVLALCCFSRVNAQQGCPVNLGPDTLNLCLGEQVTLVAHNVPATVTGTLCGTANENGVVNLSAPAGSVFTAVLFASYGAPVGSCGAYSISGCHASNTAAIVAPLVIGNSSVSIPATNDLFGDPCSGTPKRLTVQLQYQSQVVQPTVLWSTGSQDAQLQYTPSVSEWISVDVNATGILCSDSVYIAVRTNNFELSVDTISLCAPDQVTLVAPGDYQAFNWNTGALTNEITINQSGIYSVEVTDQYGCTAQDDVVVSVIDAQLPFVAERFCFGSELPLEVSLDSAPILHSVLWGDGSMMPLTTLTVTEDTIVNLSVSNGLLTCFGTAQVFVSSPFVDLGPDTLTRCGFEPLVLEGPAGYSSYNWNTGASLQSIEVNENDFFQLVVTDSIGCTASDAIQLFVLGQGIIASRDTICTGESVVLSVTEYPFTGESGVVCGTAVEILNQSVTLTAPAGAVFTAIDFASYGNPTGSCGNYLLGGCHAPSSMQIVQDACLGQNSCTIAADNDLFGDPCFGTNKRLTVQATWSNISPIADISWSTGEASPEIVLFPSSTSTIELSVSLNGVTCTDSKLITVNDPQLEFEVDTLMACNASILLIDAPAGFTTYSWSNGSSSEDISVSESGVYELSVTDANGCTDQAQVAVSILSVQFPSDSVWVCLNESYVLNVNSDAGPFQQSILWSDGSSNETFNYLGAQPALVGVEVTNGFITCTDSVRFELSLPLVDLGPDTLSVCGGQGFLLDAGEGYSTYEWSTNQSSQTIEPSSFGSYAVTVTDSLGCQAQDEIYLWVLGTGINQNDTTLCIGDSLQLSVSNVPQVNSSGTICSTVNETAQGSFMTLTAPAGLVFTAIDFASYGQPNGTCGGYSTSSCHAPSSLAVVSSYCLGQSSCTIPVSNAIFSDPCPGDPKRLTVQARYGITETFANVQWSTGESDEIIWVAPSESTVYSLQVSNDNLTCIDEIAIGVNNPQLDLPYDTLSFCSVESIMLEAPSGLVTYVWSDGQLGENVIVSMSNLYTVTGFDEIGCSVSDSVRVSIVNGSIITPDTTICIGDGAFLSVEDIGLNTLPFYFNNFELEAGQEWSQAQRIAYDGSMILGNFANQEVGFSLAGLPNHEAVIVSFDLYMIDSWDGNGPAGGETWLWTADGQTVLNTNFTSFQSKSQCYPDNCPAANPWGTGSDAAIPGYCFPMDGFRYHVVKTIPHNSATLNLNFQALGLQGLCDESWAFDDFSIELVIPQSYSSVVWSTAESSNDIVVTPTNDTWYFATISDGITTCVDSVLVSVSNPMPSFANDSLLVCSMPTFSIGLEQEWETYEWSTGETTQQIDASLSGYYYVNISDSIGCAAQDSIYLYFTAMEIQQADSAVCIGQEILLSIEDPSVPFIWSSGQVDPSILIQPGLDTLISVVYINGIGSCSDSILIRVSDPQLELTLQNISCFGLNDGQALANVNGGIEPYSFNWADSDPIALQPGSHLLILADSIGCEIDTTFVITQPMPLVAAVAGLISDCSTSSVVNWNASGGTAPYDITWIDGSQPTQSGSFSFVVVDSNGCNFEGELVLAPSIDICGCTYQDALNYDSTATVDDGSCEYPIQILGCTYSGAQNFDENATADDGSCQFINEVDACPADLNNDGLINSADLLLFLGAFGTYCVGQAP